jgi:hypothetical protein
VKKPASFSGEKIDIGHGWDKVGRGQMQCWGNQWNGLASFLLPLLRFLLAAVRGKNNEFDANSIWIELRLGPGRYARYLSAGAGQLFGMDRS